MMIIISKHRNGALDNIRVKFVDKFVKFVDMDEFYLPNNLTPLSEAVKENKATITRKSKMDEGEDEEMPPF